MLRVVTCPYGVYSPPMAKDQHDLGGGAALETEWDDGGCTYALTDGDTALKARFQAPEGVEVFDDWCPGSPSSVELQFVHWVPIGREGSAGVTSFVWRGTGQVLSTIVGEWNARYRDAAEALLRARLTELAEALPVKPGRGGGESYYSALLEIFDYAAQRHDYPLKLLSEVCRLSPSTTRTRLARARELRYARWRTETGQVVGKLRTRTVPWSHTDRT